MQAVAYMRVSTEGQRASGLGLEAQREAIYRYSRSLGIHPSSETIVSYIDRISGRAEKRKVLSQALDHARLLRVPLIFAKVDRLTRRARLLHELLDSGVELHFCDAPQASGPQGRFMLHTMANVAELEAAMISQRTKDALAAYKARGGTLGGLRAHDAASAAEAHKRLAHASQQATEARLKAADAFASRVMPQIAYARSLGASTLSQIADALNNRRIPTSRGKAWDAEAVRRVIKRVEGA